MDIFVAQPQGRPGSIGMGSVVPFACWNGAAGAWPWPSPLPCCARGNATNANAMRVTPTNIDRFM